MIPKIIQKWEQNKGKLQEWFKATPQSELDYLIIVKALFTHVIDGYNTDEISVIDDCEVQGTQIFLIHEDTYSPDYDNYLITHTYYGRTGCDTLH